MGKGKKPSPTLAVWDMKNEADHVDKLINGDGKISPVGTVASNVRVPFKRRKRN